MAAEVTTIQSLKAVDAWIDVINANINGGVRTAFKTSRLKFAGSNTDVVRGGTTSTLPLEFPEPSLVTANTVIDFSQGAITTSTETSHIAIQGTGFFALIDPGSMTASGAEATNTNTRLLLTRDGQFHTNQNGLLVSSNGYFLVTFGLNALGQWTQNGARAIYNDLDNPQPNLALTGAIRLSDFLANNLNAVTTCADGATAPAFANPTSSLVKITNGVQQLKYSSFGSTVFDPGASPANNFLPANMTFANATTSDATVLSKSLEASNASMTQSVPELSLAQKLFSALTKVIQIHQTNTDAVINLIR